MASRPRLVLTGLLTATTCALVAEGVVNVNLMPYAQDLGVSTTALGLVFVTHRLTRLVVAPWVGLLADRIGRRPPLLLGLACATLGLVALTLARGTAVLLAARALWGLASAFIVTAGLASALDIAGPAERGGILGLYQAALYGVYPFGNVVGGFLVDGLGYVSTFAACAVVVLLSAALASLTVRETRRREGAVGAPGPAAGLVDYVRLLRGPIRRYVALKMLSGFAIWGVFEATFVLFLLDAHGSATTFLGTGLGTKSLAGVLLAAMSVLGFLVGSPLVGHWSDRSGRHMRAVSGSLALTALAFAGLGVAASTEAIAVAVVALGLAIALISTPLTALVGAAAPADARAAAMAAYATLSDLANAAGAILGAAAAIGGGYRPTYLATAALVAAGALALLAPSEARRPSDPPGTEDHPRPSSERRLRRRTNGGASGGSSETPPTRTTP
jgi:MFS family permease